MAAGVEPGYHTDAIDAQMANTAFCDSGMHVDASYDDNTRSSTILSENGVSALKAHETTVLMAHGVAA
jgi:hypothetical protein